MTNTLDKTKLIEVESAVSLSEKQLKTPTDENKNRPIREELGR